MCAEAEEEVVVVLDLVAVRVVEILAAAVPVRDALAVRDPETEAVVVRLAEVVGVPERVDDAVLVLDVVPVLLRDCVADRV